MRYFTKSLIVRHTHRTRYVLLTFISLILIGQHGLKSQITQRERPKEWDQLVYGARFIDRFLPMPEGTSDSKTWGGQNVLPRYIDNGIEDSLRSYWGGNILKGEDGKYHLFVCGWPENSEKGHFQWPHSIVYHAVCDNTIGPFLIKDTIGPGHNPEAFRLQDNRYVIYVINGRYVANTPDGPWEYGKFSFDQRDRPIIEGLSNLTFTEREDGSYLMICRGGGVWISQTGLSTYNQLSDKRIYPEIAGEFEDPVVWRDHIQYHLIVNDWLGRIAYYLRSKDGVHWVTDPGEAYLPGISRHANGQIEEWFKYERIKMLQDKYGRAAQANFAVIDTLKNEDKANDRHSSKNIGIPLNPGLLLEMKNKRKITPKTKTIRIKIAEEPGFNPHTDIDLASLRFGASAEVNHGRGCHVQKNQKDGNGLSVVFNAQGNGITEEEFAPKLIGKTKQGQLLYGYVRLPWVDYTPSILSARKPTITPSGLNIVVENFGLRPSKKTKMYISFHSNGDDVKLGEIKVPALAPYEKTTLNFNCTQDFPKSAIFKIKFKQQ